MASNLALQAVISLKDEFTKVMDKASGSVKKMQADFANFQKSAGDFGKIMTVVGGAGVLALKGFIDAANEAERGQAQLNAVLKSTGGIAGVTAQQVNDLASSLAKSSTVTDDAILSGENMLLTFTNIGKDVFPTATQTMLDMAVAMNNGVAPSAEELSSQAIQLGKALNDPTKGMTALSKVGVAFTEDQEKQIKTLQKNGDMMGAQKIILDELAKEYGGSAAAAAQTFGGQMQNLQNRFGEVGESLGKALIPVLQIFGEWLGKLVSYLENLTPSQQEFLAQTLAIGTALAGGVGALALFVAALNPVTITVGLVIASFVALSGYLAEQGISWETFAAEVQTQWSLIVYYVARGVEIAKLLLADLSGASKEEYDKMESEAIERLQKLADAHGAAFDHAGELQKKAQDMQRTEAEDHFAKSLDAYNAASGKEKEELHTKLAEEKAAIQKNHAGIRLMTTEELAKTRQAAAAEMEKTNATMAAKLGEQVSAALSWGAHLIENLARGIKGSMPVLNGAIALAKAAMLSIHQSYNPEIPAQLWGEHFLQNFAAGMQNSAPKVFAETDQMKAALAAEFGNDGAIQNLLKDWTKDKSIGEHFAQIAEEVKQQTEKLNGEFMNQKTDYEDLNNKAGESLTKLKQKHVDEMNQILTKIHEVETQITDLNENYAISVQGVDTSVGEQIVKQQDLLASLKKQIDEAQAGGQDTTDVQAKYDKEAAALQTFMATSQGLEDEIAEARRRANETDFERFVEDSEARKTQLAEEHQKKLEALEEEKQSLLDQAASEKEVYDQKIAQYELLKTGFISMQGVFVSGLSTMATEAQTKVTFINQKLAEMKAAFEAMNSLSGGGSTPLAPSGGGAPGFATGGIASGSEGGYPVTLHGTEAVVPLPDGKNIPVQIQGGGEKMVTINMNFGDINISKEVDGDAFIQKMKSAMTREMQLAAVGSL